MKFGQKLNEETSIKENEVVNVVGLEFTNVVGCKPTSRLGKKVKAYNAREMKQMVRQLVCWNMGVS